MKKIFNKFLIGFLFVLGIILIPTFKVDAAITVTVYIDGVAAPKTVAYHSNVEISWQSTGATSCSEGKGRGGTGTTGDFWVKSIEATETITVTCSAPAYCSGTYIDQVDWNGENEFNWVAGTVYDGDGGGCGYCSQRGNLGYRVDTNINNVTQGRVEATWVNPTCVKKTGIGCSGSRWSSNAAAIRSAYKTFTCSNTATEYECPRFGINRSSNFCTWNP
jgi:hypothetical protein